MKFEHKPINFADGRGAIRDIFASAAPECVTLITSNPGAVRGNHLHKRSTQHAFVVSGTMTAFSRIGGDDAPVTRIELIAGDIVTHEPGEAHAYFATEPTVFLAFAEGLRKGEDYEKDTFRVPSLVDAWIAQDAERIRALGQTS